MMPEEEQSNANNTKPNLTQDTNQQLLNLALKYDLPISSNLKEALELESQGKLDKAMAKYKDEERICREGANLEGLSYCLLFQATILNYSGDANGAKEIIEEAYQVAKKGNLVELASDIRIYLTECR
jgi:hypothetical protein